MIGAAKRKNKAWRQNKNIVWYQNKGAPKTRVQEGWCPKHGMTDFVHKDIYSVFNMDIMSSIEKLRRGTYIWVCDLCVAIRSRQGRVPW